MSGILIATLVVGGIGLFIGLFLGIAAIKFKVQMDEREVAVLEALPGNNCGGCGYAGCSGLAAAIAKGGGESVSGGRRGCGESDFRNYGCGSRRE